MNKEKQCENCKYYENDKCFRFPPDRDIDDNWARFPKVMPHNWCGEYKQLSEREQGVTNRHGLKKEI